MAANNNADWYAMMFDIHGLRYERSSLAFVALDRPPPYHSMMVTLEPETGEALLDLIPSRASQPRFGIKDSFCGLRFEDLDLVELFSASWLWADEVPAADTDRWERIETPEKLGRWEAAWKIGGSPSEERQFPDPILERADVAMFGRMDGTGYDAGVIANRSSDCVGLSNAFCSPAGYREAAALCAEFGDGLPIVGYERGDDLAAATDAGFVTTGELRVAVRPIEDR